MSFDDAHREMKYRAFSMLGIVPVSWLRIEIRAWVVVSVLQLVRMRMIVVPGELNDLPWRTVAVIRAVVDVVQERQEVDTE